jgi:hypothetical protein
MVDYRIRLPPGDTRPDALWNTIPDEHAVRDSLLHGELCITGGSVIRCGLRACPTG